MREYALYKGDDILAIGTVEEIAKEMGIKPATVRYYNSQAYRRRLEKQKRTENSVRIAVPLDDGEDELL